MEFHTSNIQIVIILTIGFAIASLFGYITQRIKLSPILGYLLAGFIIGPFSPGIVANLELSEQLAEVGVILMMFGVGLHLNWKDLSKVKKIAIPGALGQTFFAAAASMLVIHALGWPWETGLIIGLAIGVASTVVLVRVLSDNNLLNTNEGHIAVGWLIVEDVLTVMFLILLPMISQMVSGTALSLQEITISFSLVLLRFFLLFLFLFTIGHYVITYILFKISRIRSQELFILTIFAIIFVITLGSAVVFGTSMALGAFLAGMMIGQSQVKHQASAHSLPMKDLFVVFFFLSVGMLFNPMAIWENMTIFLAVVGVILIVKPLSALLIALVFNQSWKTALAIAFALAQIGEFSFILSEEAMKYKLMPDEGFDIIVAASVLTISLNPFFFNYLNFFYKKAEARFHRTEPLALSQEQDEFVPHAVVVGYGPIGQKMVQILKENHYRVVIMDENVDTVADLQKQNELAIYGDAAHPELLENAGLKKAEFLLITIPFIEATKVMIAQAKLINPDVKIFARVRFLRDYLTLKEEGDDTYICCEEETLKAFENAIIEAL